MIEENEGFESLILCGGRNIPVTARWVKKSLILRFSHVYRLNRVPDTLLVPKHKSPVPAHSFLPPAASNGGNVSRE